MPFQVKIVDLAAILFLCNFAFFPNATIAVYLLYVCCSGWFFEMPTTKVISVTILSSYTIIFATLNEPVVAVTDATTTS